MLAVLLICTGVCAHVSVIILYALCGEYFSSIMFILKIEIIQINYIKFFVSVLFDN